MYGPDRTDGSLSCQRRLFRINQKHIPPTFIARAEVENETPAKSNISDIVFDNSLIDNKISKIELLNTVVKSNEIICDALKLSITNKTNIQELFLDLEFFAIIFEVLV
jgi:hypothetical protein